MTYKMEPEDFLAHFGIKGMKWGVRRNRDGGGDSAGGKPSRKEQKALNADQKKMDKAPAGTVGTATKSDGTSMIVVKKKNGEWEESFLAVDAERFIRTRQKEGHEMSDREIGEALKRARAINDYNQFFKDDPNSELRAKVDSLQLQKNYKDLQREMNPPKKGLVAKFTEQAEGAYKAYQTVDKFTGNQMSAQVNKKFKEYGADIAGDIAKSAAGVPKTKAGKDNSAPPRPWAAPNPASRLPAPGAGLPRGTPSRPTMRVNPDGSATPDNGSAAPWSPGRVRTNPGASTPKQGQTFKITDLGDVKFDYPDPTIKALPPGRG